MAPAIVEKTSVLVGADIYEFKSDGEVMRFAGYTRAYKDEPEEQADAVLPAGLKENAACQLLELKAEQNFTKPAARFTESTLVKELDRLGIGRPSTYAQIVSTILQRKYVVLQERKLFATELGETVNRILVKSFPEIFTVSFTAQMEEELDKVARDELSYEEILHDFYTPFAKALEEVKAKKGEIKSELMEESGEICDKCGRPMIVRWGRNGRFLACSGFPECKNTKPLNGEKEVEQTDEKCPECGHTLVIKTGRYGKFLACSDYPTCKFTKPLGTGVRCPKEGCDGEIIQRQSKRGKIFYGCSNYPKCDFVSWDKPVNQPCPQCGNAYLVEKSSKKKGDFLFCPKCKHEIFSKELDSVS